MGVTFRPAALLLTLSIGLTGCVSTSTGKVPVNQDKAVVDYMNLAKGYVQGGYTEKAVKPLERALEIEPRSAEVHGLLGMVYQIQGETALAEASFKTALSYDSGASDVRNNYGAFLFQRHRLSEAYQQFELASNDLAYPSRSRTFENMGVVALRQGRQTQALQHFEKALRLNSSLVKANLELADIYFNQGNNRKSWQYYQRFVGLSQQDARSLWLGIQLARNNGDRDRAASYALQLERLYPGSKELKEYRSRVGYEY